MLSNFNTSCQDNVYIISYKIVNSIQQKLNFNEHFVVIRQTTQSARLTLQNARKTNTLLYFSESLRSSN